jgi:CheY-like chemotaxis protein
MRKLKNILLIDDDEVTNFINSEIITSLDIAEEVSICMNGKEGLRYFDDAVASKKGFIVPELVFLDINMPVMDGFEFLKEFQLRNYTNLNSVIITMLTTSLRSEDMERAQVFDSIVNGYIEKPLTKTVVRNVFNQYFHD